MSAAAASLPGVVVIEPRIFRDERGYFLELWNRDRQAGTLPATFVQDNMSYSKAGVLRGLHFQEPHAQGKLVTVLDGEVLDVVVDVRCGSPAFGRWMGVSLSGENRRQMWIPPGFAHGFVVTGSHALFLYKCTDTYHPECERTLRWDDPEVGVEWPCAAPSVSPKDAQGLGLSELAAQGRLPAFQG